MAARPATNNEMRLLRRAGVALRSRARVHTHWHTFVLAVENVVVVGMWIADEEVLMASGVV